MAVPSLQELEQRVLTPDKECGCPPWVVRCAHFEGRSVTLRDRTASMKFHDLSCHFKGFDPYCVANDGRLAPAGCGCKMKNFWESSAWAGFPDLPSANAEFDRRELALMGRE